MYLPPKENLLEALMATTKQMATTATFMMISAANKEIYMFYILENIKNFLLLLMDIKLRQFFKYNRFIYQLM